MARYKEKKKRGGDYRGRRGQQAPTSTPALRLPELSAGSPPVSLLIAHSPQVSRVEASPPPRYRRLQSPAPYPPPLETSAPPWAPPADIPPPPLSLTFALEERERLAAITSLPGKGTPAWMSFARRARVPRNWIVGSGSSPGTGIASIRAQRSKWSKEPTR